MPQLMQSLVDCVVTPAGAFGTVAVEVCAQDADVGRLASSVTKRSDVIEDSVIAKSELVDIPATENVGF